MVDAKPDTEREASLVIGGTGLVGSYIVDHLLGAASAPCPCRGRRKPPDVELVSSAIWREPDRLKFPDFATLYCTADATLLANAAS